MQGIFWATVWLAGLVVALNNGLARTPPSKEKPIFFSNPEISYNLYSRIVGDGKLKPTTTEECTKTIFGRSIAAAINFQHQRNTNHKLFH